MCQLAAMPLWDVTAVIGPAASSHATTAVPLLNAAHIPVLGISPTSDILDNRADYPLFARLIQPDRYQVSWLDTVTHDIRYPAKQSHMIPGILLNTVTHDTRYPVSYSHI